MKRLALIGVVVENMDSTEKLNLLLHGYAEYIIGRMGLPCKDKGVCLISIALDAPEDIISALSGKIGRLDGVSAKTLYSKIKSE